MHETARMAFGQQAGPPASARQVQQLLELVRRAGWEDFRQARHPLALNQRQAGGRFTQDEAAALIDRLESAGAGPPDLAEAQSPRDAATRQLLSVMPAEHLAAELERRGWILIAP